MCQEIFAAHGGARGVSCVGFRVGNFRVCYELVEERAEPYVRVLAIGIKQRNRVFIGDEENIL